MSIRESELKFTSESFCEMAIKSGLDKVCQSDLNFKENIICSIYFDTPDWCFAMEKASSDFLKTKVRLRWYRESSDGTNDSSPCFLEFKRKIGSKREKERIEMPFNSTDVFSQIQQQENIDLFEALIKKHAPEMANRQVQPRFVVQYKRNRYFEPQSKTRISLDRQIQAYGVSNSTVFIQHAINLPELVLEVKGNCEDLPLALRSIYPGKLKKAAFSKYYESFKLLTGYDQ